MGKDFFVLIFVKFAHMLLPVSQFSEVTVYNVHCILYRMVNPHILEQWKAIHLGLVIYPGVQMTLILLPVVLKTVLNYGFGIRK